MFWKRSAVSVKYRDAKFGPIRRKFLLSSKGIRKAQLDINCWKDDEVLAWRNSYISSCSSIAVAGAIFASIGLSSLSLPNMYDTHWTARALLVSSMALGILSVLSATTHQQAVGMLNDHLSIRLWLSCGRTKNPEKRPPPFDELPLDCSVSKMTSLRLPQWSLNVSVVLYFLGFGLYFLFSWIEKVPQTDVLGSRNIFIVYTIVVSVSFTYAIGLLIDQLSDENQASKDFKPDNEDSLAKSDACKRLEEDLRKVQRAMAEPASESTTNS